MFDEIYVYKGKNIYIMKMICLIFLEILNFVKYNIKI